MGLNNSYEIKGGLPLYTELLQRDNKKTNNLKVNTGHPEVREEIKWFMNIQKFNLIYDCKIINYDHEIYFYYIEEIYKD